MQLSPLLSAQDLLSLEAGRYRYLDASILLPGQEGDPDADFEEIALPGAIRFRIDDVSDRADPLPHMIPGAAFFAASMTALGISRETSLVFYDQRGSVGACRACWMARLFGHENVQVLDGGLAAVLALGVAPDDVPVSAGPTQRPYVHRASYRRLAGKGDVLQALGRTDVCVLDARSAGRFYGKIPEPRPNTRGGHVPGSVNLPFTEVLTGNGSFLQPDVLDARLQTCGVTGRHAITSCGSGLTAATLTMALRIVGLPEGQLYDGSWAEWGGDHSLPVEI